MGNSASSQGSSTGTHDGDVGSSISEEQHDWPIEQAADTPDVQSLQEMRKPYICLGLLLFLSHILLACIQKSATVSLFCDSVDRALRWSVLTRFRWQVTLCIVLPCGK